MNKKQAIYYLQKILFQTTEANKCGLSNNDFKKEIECYETILDIIEKQDKQINKLKENNKNILKKLRNRVKEVRKLSKYSLYKKEFKRLNEHILEKDKLIEHLANELAKKIEIEKMIF